jgi:hypothetical protein
VYFWQNISMFRSKSSHYEWRFIMKGEALFNIPIYCDELLKNLRNNYCDITQYLEMNSGYEYDLIFVYKAQRFFQCNIF